MKIGLLLQAAGIGEDGDSRAQQVVHVEIAERLADADALEIEPQRGDLPAGAGVQRQDDGALLRLIFQKGEDLGEPLAIGGVFGAVDGRDRVGPTVETEPLEHAGAGRSGCGEEGGVVHHVADLVDALDDALATEVADRRLGRAEEQRALMGRPARG